MVDLSLEFYSWVLKGVIRGKCKDYLKLATSIWRVVWANDKTIENELISWILFNLKAVDS